MAREFPELMTPAEVGAALRSNSKTVTRWAKAGRFRYIRTPGIGGSGHLRFFRGEIEAYIAGKPLTEAELDALVRGEPDDA